MPHAGPFNTRPLYQQVADEFIGRIISGIWQPGQSIENEAEVARSLGISLGTVRKAFEILSDFDLLERHQGKGTVVTDQIGSRSRFSNIRADSGDRLSGDIDIDGVELTSPDPTTAEALGVNVRTPVLSFRRLRRHRGRAFMAEDVFLRVDASARDMAPDALRQLAAMRWISLDLATGMRETVCAGLASDKDAAALEILALTPVLMLERVIHSYRGKPLEMRRAVCRLDPDLHYLVA